MGCIQSSNPTTPSSSSSGITPSISKLTLTQDLNSYQDALKFDPILQSFDTNLQYRTSRIINSLALEGEVWSLSLNSLKVVTTSLLDMNQEFVNILIESKEDIWNNDELFVLVQDFFDLSLLTLEFYTSLQDCLKNARHSENVKEAAGAEAIVSAPPLVMALAAAVAVPLGSMRKWDLDNIKALVDKLGVEMEGLVMNAQFAISEEEEKAVGAGVVVEIGSVEREVGSTGGGEWKKWWLGGGGLGVNFSKKKNDCLIVAFSDSDWAKCLVTRKSVSGYFVFINGNLGSWKSKRQTTLSKSSAKAEYRCDVCSHGVVLWELCTMEEPLGGINAMQDVGALGFQHRLLKIPNKDESLGNDLLFKMSVADDAPMNSSKSDDFAAFLDTELDTSNASPEPEEHADDTHHSDINRTKRQKIEVLESVSGSNDSTSRHNTKLTVEKKYPLKKEILVQMLNLRLESEEESTMALELIRFIKKGNQLTLLLGEELASPRSNSSCPNSNDEELSIPEQTATGKGTSNPLMAGSLPKTTKPT
ncbi:UPF0496 protein-like protein [Tanacetum coccineum]